MLSKDFSGATTDYFESRENGVLVPTSAVYGLPPGPYHSAMAGMPIPPFTMAGAAAMRRMTAGGSDYLVLVSASASSLDKGVAKVYYVLRDSGQLIRVTNQDTGFSDMDYVYDAHDNDYDVNSAYEMDLYEETCIIAENVGRLKFSFLDRSDGPVSQNALDYADGPWVDDWDWASRPYLPGAIKVQLQLVDHLWKTADTDRISNANFNPLETNDGLRASEMLDPDDGEPFTFIIDLPLGQNRAGG